MDNYKLELTNDEIEVLVQTVNGTHYPGSIAELIVSIKSKLVAAREVKATEELPSDYSV